MFRKLSVILMVSLFTVAALCAAPKEEARDFGKLVISVQGPLGSPLYFEQAYEDSMYAVLTNALQRTSAKAELAQRYETDLTTGERLLDVRVLKWNIDRVGNAQCTIRVDLVEGEATHHLGLFYGVGLGITSGSRSRMDMARLMDNAAEVAAQDMWRRLAKTL